MKKKIRRLGYWAIWALLLSAPGIGSPQQKSVAPANAAAAKSAVPFIENDFGRALQDAQRRNVKLFIDLWAPW